jgi:uncharacterized membrane protein
MRRFLLPLFIGLIVAVGAFIVTTSAGLPERVASHFARGGQANGWMQRDAYLGFILSAAIGLPLVLVASLAWLPRVFPRAVNLPNRAYWFEPERRNATLATLSAFAWAFGCVLTLLVGGLHWAVVQANSATPPALEASTVNALLSAFVLAIACWILAWLLRFRRPR